MAFRQCMFISGKMGSVGYTDLATVGAIALQGPHHVAKASRTTTLLSLMADWNSALLEGAEMLAFVQAPNHEAISSRRERYEPCEIVDAHVDG